jgi:hypothetical protein
MASRATAFTFPQVVVRSNVYHPYDPRRSRHHHHPHPTTTVLHMALTPVGPFCPFRSSAAIAMDPKMNALNAAAEAATATASGDPGTGDVGFATEMSRIQLEMQMGQMPNPQRLLKVADDMESAVDQWESLILRLKLSRDFQTREYAKLTQAHLATHGVTVESIASMMKWQSGCLRALATNQPPPMPPPDMNLEKMIRDAQDAAAAADKGGMTKPPSMTAMQAAQAITASPFSLDSFTSDTVKNEYQALVRDHSSLIEFGAKYDDFDPLGKLAYLDQIEAVEDRWNVFFLRFQLMGALNADYQQQCDAFLASMNLKEDQYRDLLKKCHEIMRQDAQRERDLRPM